MASVALSNKEKAKKMLEDRKLMASVCRADFSGFVRLVAEAELTTEQVKKWLVNNGKRFLYLVKSQGLSLCVCVNQELDDDDEV